MYIYAERMRGLREDRDMTQADVAKLIGTTKNQIGKYERSEQEMTVSVLIKICKLFNISANYLLDLPKDGYDPRREK